MRAASAIAAAALLTGCTHFAGREPAWYCFDRIQQGELDASSALTLARNGQPLELNSHWMRPFTVRPRLFIDAQWIRTGLHSATDGKVTFRFASARPLGRHRLELRSGSVAAAPTDPRLASKLGEAIDLVAPWSAVAAEAFSGRPLFIVAVSGEGEVLDSEPVDPALFRQGLALVARTDAAARARAAAPAARCEKHQEIIVT